MGVSGQRHAPAALCPGEKPHGTHCTGGWMGFRAGLDTEVRGKILCPCRGSNPDRPVIQSVVRHYTDSATPVPRLVRYHPVNNNISIRVPQTKAVRCTLTPQVLNCSVHTECGAPTRACGTVAVCFSTARIRNCPAYRPQYLIYNVFPQWEIVPPLYEHWSGSQWTVSFYRIPLWFEVTQSSGRLKMNK
jgi:hypothetical protein